MNHNHILARILEPFPADGWTRFGVGDTVKLVRQDVFNFIPLGAPGVVKALEHPDSNMASKGRVYLVEFDVSAFKLPYPAAVQEWAAAAGVETPPYQTVVTTNMGPNDLELVQRGTPPPLTDESDDWQERGGGRPGTWDAH